MRVVRDGEADEDGKASSASPGSKVGEIMRRKLIDDGWQFLVVGHRWAWDGGPRQGMWQKGA